MSAPGSGEAPVVRGDAPGWGWGLGLRLGLGLKVGVGVGVEVRVRARVKFGVGVRVRLRVRVRSREGRRAWQTLVRDGAAAAREIHGRRGEHPLRGRRVGLGRRRGQATGQLVRGSPPWCSGQGCADEVLPG